MQIRALAVLLFAVLLAEGLLVPPAAPKPRAPPPYSAIARGWETFPPARPPRAAATAATATPVERRLDDEIGRLGAQPPRYPSATRRTFAETADLYQFVQGQLPAAVAGNGESQYLIHLALEQCRVFLRLNPESVLQVNETMLGSASNLTPEERLRWEADYQRCLGFAINDWSAVGEALGTDRPGAETEYGLVWLERAAQAGYPLAMAEQALRPELPTPQLRRAQLERAASSGDPGVYWLLFVHHDSAASASVPSRAWLLLACRKGLDCGQHARWYRELRCLGIERSCPPGVSAIQHYWNDLTTADREQAWRVAGEIESSLRSGKAANLPWPPDVFLTSQAETAPE